MFIGTVLRFIAFVPSYAFASLKLGASRGKSQAESDTRPAAPQEAPKE